MRAHIRSWILVAPVLGLFVAAGCGDDTTATTSPAGDAATAADAPSPNADITPVAGTGSHADTASADVPDLPEVPPLEASAARDTLLSLAAEPVGDDVTRATLLYLVELGETDAVAAAREKLLVAKYEGEPDVLARALAHELAFASGDESSAAALMKLTTNALADDENLEFCVHALARIDGPERPAAEKLLLQIAEEGDDGAAMLATSALASWGYTAADDVFAGIAADAENRYTLQRAMAVAALLSSTHARGVEAANRLVAERDLDPTDIIAGLGVSGVVQCEPVIKAVVERGLKTGDGHAELASGCFAIAEIYRDRNDREKGLATIDGWLQRSKFDDAEGVAARFVLRAPDVEDRVAAILRRDIADAANRDLETAIDLLEEIGRRGLGRSPPFAQIVAAAAQFDGGGKVRAGGEFRLAQMHAAAAYAYLASGNE